MLVPSPFDNLVAELSGAERTLLLERIKAAMSVSSEPLFPAQAAPGAEAAAAVKAEDLGILPRLILFLRALFSGKSREELLREDELRDVARRIEQRNAGMIERRHSLILAPVVE